MVLAEYNVWIVPLSTVTHQRAPSQHEGGSDSLELCRLPVASM